MKRSIILVMALIMCISLCSCSKSEAAINADNLILAIGEVTIDSINDIGTAAEAVANLEENDYKQLEQIAILVAARSTYDELVKEKEIYDIQEAIDAIGVVTLDSVNAISIAQSKYNVGSVDVKNRVNNYATLEGAIKELSALKIERVTTLISEMGNVTLDNTDRIIAAKIAYYMLSEDEKTRVTNKEVVEAAIIALDNLKKTPKVLKDYKDYPGVLDFGAYSGLSPDDKEQVNNEHNFVYNNAGNATIKSYIDALKDKGFKDYDTTTGTRENETWLENDNYKILLSKLNVNLFYISISSKQETPSTRTPQSKPDLSLKVGDFTIDYGYANVEVTVTNNTENSSYTFIKAKVIFQTSDGNVITTDETYANSSTPLLPGESRIFSFFTNVGVDSCTSSVSIIDYKKE